MPCLALTEPSRPALLIFLNFVLNALEAEYNPEPGSRLYAASDHGDLGPFPSTLSSGSALAVLCTDAVLTWWCALPAFTIVFTLDLLFNMFGTWFKPFVRDLWNVYDFVVTASLLPSTALCDERNLVMTDTGHHYLARCPGLPRPFRAQHPPPPPRVPVCSRRLLLPGNKCSARAVLYRMAEDASA